MRVHFESLPTAIGNHDIHGSRLRRSNIGGQVDFPQCGLVNLDVAMVDSPVVITAFSPVLNPGVIGPACPARADIGKKVFDRSQHAGNIVTVCILQAANECGCQFAYQLSILTKAFKCAPPSNVLGNTDCRGEVPAHSGAHTFGGNDTSHALYQFSIMGRAQADVVGENYRPLDVVMPMNRIGTVD